MGLDMYLHKRKGDFVFKEVAYWRKENHIHKWFVDNVQNGDDNCGDYLVTREQLNQLIAACNAVIKNEKVPAEVLPTQGGFFFGPTDYDESYIEGCENTVKMLTEAMTDEDCEFYYSSSW